MTKNYDGKFTKTDGIFLFMLFLCALKLVAGLEQMLELGLYDESMYMRRGLEHVVTGWPPAQGSLLYTVWYYFWSLFVPDRFELYYFNQKIFSILLPLTIYGVARRWGAHPYAALVVGFLYLVSFGNAYVWPKVAHCSVFFLLLPIIFFGRFSFPGRYLVAAVLGTLLGSLARPEMGWSFVASFITAGVYGVWLYRKGEKKDFKPYAISLGCVTFVFLLLQFTIGSALEGGRSWPAFHDQFAINYVRWNNLDVNPWTHANKWVDQFFPGAKSISEAAVINPKMMARHVFTNLIHIPVVLVHNMFRHHSILLPETQRWMTFIEMFLLGSILIFGFYFLYQQKFLVRLKDQKDFLLVTALACVGSVVAAIIVYPRDYYLLPLVALLFALLAGSIKQTVFSKLTLKLTSLVWLGLFLLLITPKLGPAWYETKPVLEKTQLLEFVKKLDLKPREQPYVILGAHGEYTIYLVSRVTDENPKFRWMAEFDKARPWVEYMQDKQIDLIDLDNKLLKDLRFKEDLQFQEWYLNPEKYGFTLFAVPKTERYLAVRTEILQTKPERITPRPIRVFHGIE